MFPLPYGETVTRLRGTAQVDPYSGEPDGISWDAPDSLDIPGCAFDPGGSQEPTADGRSSVITRPTVLAAFGSDILPGDRLVVRGKTYEVEGDPAEYHHPMTGWEPGMTVTLERVDG